MPLVVLDASNNQMTGIPAEIGQLHDLQTLNYADNNISTIPKELLSLKQLKTLILTGNPLSQATINELKANLPNTSIQF
jgi:Leucine-rich repeat (LRR) protein